MKGSWWLGSSDNGSGLTRREERHAQTENDRRTGLEHIKKQAKAAKAEAARRQRRAAEEKRNIERIQKRREAAEKDRARKGSKDFGKRP